MALILSSSAGNEKHNVLNNDVYAELCICVCTMSPILGVIEPCGYKYICTMHIVIEVLVLEVPVTDLVEIT